MCSKFFAWQLESLTKVLTYIENKKEKTPTDYEFINMCNIYIVQKSKCHFNKNKTEMEKNQSKFIPAYQIHEKS